MATLNNTLVSTLIIVGILSIPASLAFIILSHYLAPDD